MISSVVPIFAVSDSDRAEAYYCDILGFRKTFAYRPDSSRRDPCYFGVACDGVELHLHSYKPERVGMGGAFFLVTDVDGLYAEVLARGALSQLPPTDQTWGTREAHLRDPDGNGICFARKLEKRDA